MTLFHEKYIHLHNMNKILLLQPFQGHYSHCIENSQLICWANQLTGFYMIETLALTKFGPVLFQIETSHLICTTLVSIWKATIGWDGLKWVNCWWWVFLQVFFCFNKHIFWYNTRILLTKISPHRLCKYKMELKEIGNIAYKSISTLNETANVCELLLLYTQKKQAQYWPYWLSRTT